jgi:glycerophosphoryl diester phosphodiesterase
MRSLLCGLDRRLAPAPDPARVGWLKDWTYAHRGLHGDGRVENSPSDIQRSRDEWPMVYHDWDFSRLHGRAETGEELARDEWLELRYRGAEEGPCTLADLLEMVAGRVPLLIEIKSRADYDVERTCRRVADMLAGYDGHYAVMSFDPRVSRWLARHAPQIVRGLVMRQDAHSDARTGFARRVALWIARPDFVAFDVRALPDAFAAALRARGFPLLTWTVKTPALAAIARAHADAAIAEGGGLP